MGGLAGDLVWLVVVGMEWLGVVVLNIDRKIGWLWGKRPLRMVREWVGRECLGWWWAVSNNGVGWLRRALVDGGWFG